MAEGPPIPTRIRVHLAHATVEAIAMGVGADVLHIKGPATHASLRPATRSSADADLMVRPSHFTRFQGGLKRHGWHQMTRMRSGGLVEHSTNWFHPKLGQLDVHFRFPGIQVESEKAFETLWRDHGTHEVAHQPCTVPRLEAQRLILLLHAARSLSRHSADVQSAWTDSTPSERAEVTALAAELRADVALAAATGRLDEFRAHPEHDLWRLYLDETVTKAGFRRVAAEIKAAPDGIRYPRLQIVRFLFVTVLLMSRRVSNQTGRPTSLRELVSAYRTFIARSRDAF